MSKIKDAAKAIRKYHDFFITADYWPRIGIVCNRYGADNVCSTIESLNK